MLRPAPLSHDDARRIGDAALAFLAKDPQRLIRFLETTGITPAQLRAEADSDATLAAVVNHVLEDESLLMIFAAEVRVQPEQIAPVAAMLGGERRARQ